MSEENKNRNKDKGKQRNVKKYDTTPNHYTEELAREYEYVNKENKKNKRKK
ncbi:MAG TPA: hypothetical protein VK142_10360 [Bacillota bacterium]|nr:hypothetical protein [Bacillota bacterium]